MFKTVVKYSTVALTAAALFGGGVYYWTQPSHLAAVTLPAEVRGNPGEFIAVPAETSCKYLEWFVCDGRLTMLPPQLLKDTKTVIVSGPKGQYKLYAYGASGSKPTKLAECRVVIGGDQPDPGPGPGPKPPTPPPGPTKLKVLFTYETGKQNNVPQLFSKQVWDYLDAHCTQGPKNKDFRIWDPDIVPGQLQPFWADFQKRPRTSLPWVLIADQDAKILCEEALPATPEGVLALLKKYGG